jgi:hypothetical protein
MIKKAQLWSGGEEDVELRDRYKEPEFVNVEGAQNFSCQSAYPDKHSCNL